VDWCFLDTSGALGGIVLMWDMRVVEKVKESVGEYTLPVVEDQFTWAFASVYGPNYDCDRRFLWDELLNWWNLSWCIMGNFNVTRSSSERLGEARL
jgi:hypothetical protein